MFKNLTKREKTVIMISIFALLSAIYFVQLYQPLVLERTTLEKEIINLRSEYQQKLNLIKRRLPEVKETISGLETDYQQAIQQFPNQEEISAFLLEITELATRQGIKIDYFTPRNIQGKGEFYELPINISFYTNYGSLVSFIYVLEHSFKKIEIVNLDVVTSGQTDNKPLLQVDATLEIYLIKL